MESCKFTLSSWNLRTRGRITTNTSWKNDEQFAWKKNNKSVWKNKGIAAWKIANLPRGRTTRSP
eukprot:4150504-Heterocapsa_arctica.AAC.1